jgi:hypothetical protein
VFSKSRKANGVIFPMDRPPGIPNPSSKSEGSAPSVWLTYCSTCHPDSEVLGVVVPGAWY